MNAVTAAEAALSGQLDLANISAWVIYALHNADAGSPWVPRDFLGDDPDSFDGGEYTALYAGLVECPDGVAPFVPPLLLAWTLAPIGPCLPAQPGHPDTGRFLSTFGNPAKSSMNRRLEQNALFKDAAREARALLGLPIKPPASVPAATKAPPPPPAATAPRVPAPPAAKLVVAKSAPLVAPAPKPLPPPEPVIPPRELDGATWIPARPMHFTPIAQVQGALMGPRQPASDVFVLAMQRVIAWLHGKGVSVPDDWRAIPSWESGTDGAARQVWYESAAGHVAIRFDEPCRELPGRQWRVEVILVEDRSCVLLGVKLSALVQQGVDTKVHPSVPSLVRAMTEGLSLVVDGQMLATRPTLVTDAAGVERLARLIQARRSSAVAVCLTPGPHSKEASFAGRLANRVAGVAHVVALAAHLAPALEAALGAAGRIPPGGVRLYGRDFDPALAAVRCPILPLALWPTQAGVDVLRDACVAETVSMADGDDLPSFAHVRQLVARRRRQDERSRHDDDSRQVEERWREAVAQRDAIEQDLRAAEQLVDELQGRVNDQSEALQRKDARIWVLEQRVLALESRETSDQAPAVDVAALATWDAVFQWADEALADRLVLTDKARRAARSSVYEDVGFAGEVLALLAGPYWAMRAGDEQARDTFLAEAQRLRVEVSGVGSAPNHSRLAGQYRVTWKGRTYDLDLHASGSSSRRRQHGFRVYFAWDEERKMIVVGSLPEHLTNTHS